jgi:hypothetical protein
MLYRRPSQYLVRLVITAFAIAVVVTTVRYASVQARTWGSYLLFRHDLATLERARLSGENTDVVFDVPYRGAQLSVVVPVDTGYLAAARRVNGSALFGLNRTVRRAAMRSLVAEQAGDPFVSALSSRLHSLRTQLDLSDDDYVDLIARTVQAIPYGTLHRSTFMPVVTVAGDSGVCSDKSVLLASVLAHEGYDVGVWVFPTQAHAAVAVRGQGPGIRGTGYNLIETTRLTYVGEIDYTLRAAGPVCETPQLIAFGSGTKRYARDLQTEFIADTLERARGPRRLIPKPRERSQAEPSLDGAATRSSYTGAALPSQQLPSPRLAEWIDSQRDWPEVTYAALVATGSGR